MAGVRTLCYVALTAYLVLASAAPRVRRQISFTIISNESLPCTSVASQYGADTPIVDLTDEEKRELLQMYGGQYMPRYMARTAGEAATNFHNLIALPEIFQERIKQLRTNGDRSPVRKQEVIDYMINHVYNGFADDNSNDESRSGSPTDVKADPEPRSKRLSFRELIDEMKYNKDVQRRRKDWRDWLERDERNRNFPLMFPEMVGLPRTVTNSDGSTSTTNYCLYRGDITPDNNHLRLCTVCSSTRSFGADMWPEYINEANCSVDDNGCLFTDSVSNGSCQQVTMSLMMLQKDNNHCVLVLRDGQQVVAHEWMYVYRDIGVGCECNVKDTSYFVIFV